jgi:hypothetical protein
MAGRFEVHAQRQQVASGRAWRGNKRHEIRLNRVCLYEDQPQYKEYHGVLSADRLCRRTLYSGGAEQSRVKEWIVVVVIDVVVLVVAVLVVVRSKRERSTMGRPLESGASEKDITLVLLAKSISQVVAHGEA